MEKLGILEKIEGCGHICDPGNFYEIRGVQTLALGLNAALSSLNVALGNTPLLGHRQAL